MTRRSFLRRTLLGIGAVVTLATTNFDTFATALGIRTKNAEPFPVWHVYWKQPWTGKWHAKTKMNLPDGVMPPTTGRWNGDSYDLFRYDVATQKVWYYKQLPHKSCQVA